MNNKYTIVYGDFFQIGSHSNSVTKYKHVKGSDLNSAVESSGIDWTTIWFVFEGHCEVAKD